MKKVESSKYYASKKAANVEFTDLGLKHKKY